MAALFVAGLPLSVDGRVGAQVPQSAPPATPTGLAGTFTHESVSLSWDDPGDPSITGYQILRRERGVHEVGDFQIHVDDTNSAASSYVDTAVEAEASYVYRVKARNSSGLSERSRFFRADLPTAPDPPAPGLPDPPTNLMAAAAGETQLDLSWTAPEDTNGSDVVGYRIEVSTDAGTSWTDLIADTGSTITTYAHTGLESGASRHYRTSAINSVGTGAPSNITSATTDDLTPPGFVAAVVGADGDSLELYFNEPLDLDPGRTPRASSFAVTADGALIAVGAVQVIPGRKQSVSLIGLSPAIRQGQTVRVSYTDPTGGNDEAAIQDRAGNDAASLTDQPVTNGSTATGADVRSTADQGSTTLSATAAQQIGAILAAKAQRTPAQRKVSSQLLDAIGSAQLTEEQEGGKEQPDASPGWPPSGAVGSRPPGLPADSGPQRPSATDGVGEFEFVTVDIRADVTPEVLGRIRALGGTVINSVPRYRAIRARLPLVAVQPLAALSAVQSIRPADQAVTRKVNTSEGDAAQQADAARTTHDVTGAGIGIGVISDGVRTLAAQQASGDLPAQITVLPGQEGSGNEGTAMLEIVHDLAPGADLYFATGFSGQAQFAANIEALCEAGADVIVDDIGYFVEATLQDGIIAQGVNAATAEGCYFFSAAGNDGNLNDGTSRVWEGDYAAGTPLIVDGSTVGVRHDFGGGEEENPVQGRLLPLYPQLFQGRVVLQWADPLGASANDYDLFIVGANGDVLRSSTDTQDGTQDPIEDIATEILVDAHLVVVKVSGADRYFRLQAFGGLLGIATGGNTYGHTAAENTVGVGQVDVRTAGGAGGIFNGTESVAADSSDGPRRFFFEPDGTPITQGNFSSTGGEVLQKPDLAAAGCVSTATPGFAPFCGTSAAAPHAAAIAALMLEAAGGPAHVTLAELRTAMTATTAVIDIEATGVDYDSGAGIVMAPGAIAGVAVAVAARNRAPAVTTTLADRTLPAGSDAVTIDLASTFTDPDSNSLTYNVVSGDPDRVGVTLTGAQITLTPGSPGWSMVTARVTDPGGLGAVAAFTVTVTAGTGNTDYDTDDDGLIEVTTLAQLNAIRYDLNGDGFVDGATWEPYYAETAFSTGALGMGCPYGCVGYELAANLDFDTDGSGIADPPDTYWNNGAGWEPIGNEDDPFMAEFAGERHTLANLFINRPAEDGIGLFGEVHSGNGYGIIHHLSLVEVDVTGRDAVGALLGRSTYAGVIGSYATGRVAGRGDKVGGLAGESSGNLIDTYAAVEVSGIEAVGGLVGHHILNMISSSYATGNVSGMYAVGGLVGATSDFLHLIQATYATGDVSGAGARLSPSDSGFIVCGFLGTYDAETSSGGGIGGLVGHSCGGIEASYATGGVSGEEAVGGLLGSGLHGSIHFSYWDMETSGLRVGAGEHDTNDNGLVDGAELQRASLVGMTTAALQEPTDYDGIYSAWAVDLGGPHFGDGLPDELWDFGATTQYPALPVDLNRDARKTWQEFGYQFRSALALTATTTSGQAQVDLSWAAADVSPWTPTPSVTYTVYRDDGSTVVAVAEDLTGTVYADTDVSPGARYSYQVAAVVDGGEVVRSARAAVTAGVANQPPVAAGILADQTLLLGAAAATVDVAAAFRDSDGDTLTHAAASSAPSVASVSVSGSEVVITPETGGRAIITVTATDSVGSNPGVTQRFTVSVGNDYDSDDDGLIEIRTLAQLDAMRHTLDGGVIPDDPAAYVLAFPAPIDRMGCGLEGCSGYELMEDLDFDTDGSGTAGAGDAYWNSGAGWAPIGLPDSLLFETFDTSFDTTFDGNDHAIANLFVNGGDFAGLFGALGRSAVIRNLSLTDIDVTGEDYVGGLVGQNFGTVIATRTTGQVRGENAVGGLAGASEVSGSITRSSSFATARPTSPPPILCPPTCGPASDGGAGAGGLVGANGGIIRSSYATGDVTGYPVGGLVGWNRGGNISDSYATGAVTGTLVGGLVGRNDASSGVETSYATGRVSGNLDVGGLVGTNVGIITASYSTGPPSATPGMGSTVGGLVGDHESGFSATRYSYWDSTTSGIAGGQSTAALQGPTAYSGLYQNWNRGGGADGPWDLGTSAQYPALSVDFDGDGNETWQEFGHQLRAGPELTATRGTEQVVLDWPPVDAGHWTRAPGITYTLYRDATVVAENLSTLSYQDSGLTAGDYTYQLAAVVDGGEATRSALVTGTVSEVGPNNEPQFPSSETGARSVDENTAAGMNIGTAIAAEDDDNDPLTYSISGADAAPFDVVESSGQLQTSGALDHESRDTYSFTMLVRDGKDIDGNADTADDDTITVAIEVTNVDEAGKVTLWPAEPRMRTVLSATLEDPDGGVRSVSWRWSTSTDQINWAQLSTSGSSYAPTRSNVGTYIRARASYSDASGSGKTAEAVSSHVVGEREAAPAITVVPLVRQLRIPWDLAFTPDGTMLFTERAGRLVSRLTNGTVLAVTADFSDLYVVSEAGLMAIVVDPGFSTNRRFYTCQAHSGAEVQVIAWTMNEAYTAATRVDDPLVGGIPGASRHSGCRLRFGPQGYLWIATGDAARGTVPQDLASLGGKVLRVNAATGAAAPGNPFSSLVYTYGHRNVQGLALRPGTNQMWSVEHGPTVDDEINLLTAGGNYGWNPVPGYNESVPMTDLEEFSAAVAAKWSSGDPTLATSGGIFLEGAEWEEWNGRLAVATLKNESLRIFDFNTDGTLVSHVVAPKLDGAYGRLRTPVLGPDGALYITTSNGGSSDRILRVVPSLPPEFPSATDTQYVAENRSTSTVVATVAATDANDEALTYTLGGTDADSFNIDDNAVGQVRANLPLDREVKSSYTVTVTATDPWGLSDRITLTIIVSDVNEPPTINGDATPSLEEEGTLLVGTYQATDPEGATIAWLPLDGADKDEFEFTPSNGRLAFKTAPDFEDTERGGDNEYRVTLGISAGGHTITFDVAVTVTNKEEGGALGFSSPQPQAGADYTATLSDLDGVQSTTWTWERSTSRNGPWMAVSGAILDSIETSVYTPDTDDVGYFLRVTAAYTDGHGPNKSRVLVSANTVKAAPVTNDPPSFDEPTPTRSIAENAGARAAVGRPVTATDPNSGDVLTYELSGSDLFTIDSNGGQIRVAADESLDHETAPSHRVTVTASDSSTASATVTVTITVDDVNEPPTAEGDSADTREDSEVTIDVVDNDSDPEDERSALTLLVATPPRWGSLVVNASANPGDRPTITYTPRKDYNGADSFEYRLRDTGGLTDTALVAIDVIAMNDAPTFASAPPTRSVSESAEAGDNVGAPVTATDVDENDTLTYSLFGANASSFEIDSNGQITVATGVTFDIATRETYIVTVEAYDGTDAATVEVTITLTAGPVGPPIITGGGFAGGGGGGGGGGPSPSEVDFEWNVTRDIEELDGGHDKPSGLWSDGTTLWILENGDGADDAVYAYDLKTGERVEEREFELAESNRAPRGLWSNGKTAWVADSGQDRLFAYDLESGERVEEREVELAERNRDPRGIWSDGTTVWVLDGGKNALFAYDLASGELIAEYALDDANGDPRGLWSDGVTVWVSDHGAKRLFAYRLAAQDAETTTGEDEEAAPLDRVRDEEFAHLSRASNNSPRGIWSDGDVVYVADESDDKVYSYNLPGAIDARLASLTLSGIEFGEFDPGRTEYEGVAGEGVTETTVEAPAMQRRADVGIDPPDADAEADGHQVALQDLGEISVTVSSADGSRRRVYVVRLGGPEREAPSDPTSRCFRGDVVEGFSLLIYEGGSLENLVVCAASRYVVALYVLDHGVYVPYIVGAPDFVNRSFHELYPDGVLPLTPLVAGSDGPPSGGHVVDGLAQDEPATLRESNCLYGEIATGFSLAIFEGGSVEELEACGRGFGIAAFYALHEGDWVPFILGAPDFVNAAFRELFAAGLPAVTPLVVKSN